MRKFILLILLLSLYPISALAANHYIRPAADCANNGDGSTWACAASPGGAGAMRFASTANPYTRGDTYYIAGSANSYGDVTIKQTASGTDWVYFKKATVSAHGSDTGWDASFGTAVADFSKIQIQAQDNGYDGGYIEIDGVTGSGTSGYGIKVHSETSSAILISIPAYYNGSATNYTLKHIEICHDSYVEDDSGDGINSTGAYDTLIFQNLYIHDIARNNMTITGPATNVSILDCYIERNHSTASTHGNGIQFNSGTNITIARNWFEDITGTADIACLGGAETYANYLVYNNVFVKTASFSAGSGHGIFSTNTTDTSIDTLKIYNNSIINYIGSGANYARVYIPSTVQASIEIKNNLWYCTGENCVTAQNSTGAAITAANNWYSNAITHNNDAVHYGDATNPFVNYAGADFRLVSGASTINSGADLSATFTTDILGNTRPVGAWDIGAYEYIPPQTYLPWRAP